MCSEPRLHQWNGTKANLWKLLQRIGTIFICNKSFAELARILLSPQVDRSTHFIYLRTRFVLLSERVTSLHRGEEWWFPDAALMSGLGRVVVYVCQQNRKRGEGGGIGALVPAETWEQETHAPHFLSPLYQHLALCYSRALKASSERLATDKCLFLLVFLWGSNEGLYPPVRPPPSPLLPPHLLHLSLFFSCSIPVSALRCHKRSYSLWFTLLFLKDGLGTPKRTMLVLVLLKEWIFTRHQRKGMRNGGWFRRHCICAHFCKK